MALIFEKVRRGYIPSQALNKAYLQPDNWDDYGFKTLFSLTVFDEHGSRFEIGSLKIGYIGQESGWTEEHLDQQFESLAGKFFSLGQDADYYQNIAENLTSEMAANLLTALRDVSYNASILEVAESEASFNTSLLRSINRTSIEHQFRRIIEGNAPLSEYNFYYEKVASALYSGLKIKFKVTPQVKPPTNLHVLIGRNGVGKTTLLNNMVDALLPDRGTTEQTGSFYRNINIVFGPSPLTDDYFAGVVSVSFSAFDPFTPPLNQPDASAGMRYHYIGLKNTEENAPNQNGGLKDPTELSGDFIMSIKICLTLSAKRSRWINAIGNLESDSNFAEMNLHRLVEMFDTDDTDNKRHLAREARSIFRRLSSGHAIVLLTITKLVETVEEKTLVLLDEPESHLHPPLLSAFTRALSDLLVNRNGVAIIATHSPVVLQEVPKSCVSILRRRGLVSNVDRPEQETFGENVGVLTREVFGLEVIKSGYHDLLTQSVAEGKTYEQIEEEYNHQLGYEARALLRSLIATRDLEQGVE